MADFAAAVVGLTSAEARSRAIAEGKNALPSPKRRRLHQRLASQFASALSLLLLGAAMFDLALWVVHGGQGFPLEPVAILAILGFNAVLGVVQEYRSEEALGALRSLAQPVAWVLRDGSFARLDTRDIVSDDVLRLEAGDRVPADGSIIEQSSLAVDESVLTGESLPIDKHNGDDVASGTLVVRGFALVRVTATGAKSTMGRLASALSKIEATRTPLERRLDAFGRQIAWSAAGLVVALVVLGLLSEGMSRADAVITFAIAFAVAIVPEGMPAMVTLTLALGVERMARRKAVVRRLAAVEALGSVTVVATDKTGTLTENRVRVAAVFAENERELINACVLANDAPLAGELGDPLDVALISYAKERGVDVASVRGAHLRISNRPFDAAWRYARVTFESSRGVVSYIKGAFEVLLERSRLSVAEAEKWRALNDREAAFGRRVIAVGRAAGEREDEIELLGLVSTWDPPRNGVAAAVESVRRAGVRVLMLTGDHPATAAAIAEQVGLTPARVVTGDQLRKLPLEKQALELGSADVVARATAEDKLTIVRALQSRGEVVAMTGDGVNDAPALKCADIGIAMGERGSDVAREVSDLVLLDDDFSTIVRALEEGRNIYDNIQKFIRFTFSTNVALALIILGGAAGSYFVGLRTAGGALLLPLSAVQILFINFVGDGPPALALAMDRSATVMQRGPRAPKSPLLDQVALRFILLVGSLQAAVGLGLLLVLPKLGFEIVAVQTSVFLYEASAKVLSVYPTRRVSGSSDANTLLHASAALGLALTACTLFPSLRSVFGVRSPSISSLLVVASCLVATWLIIEAVLFAAQRTRAFRVSPRALG